jgi:hypothetical protein
VQCGAVRGVYEAAGVDGISPWHLPFFAFSLPGFTGPQCFKKEFGNLLSELSLLHFDRVWILWG